MKNLLHCCWGSIVESLNQLFVIGLLQSVNTNNKTENSGIEAM